MLRRIALALAVAAPIVVASCAHTPDEKDKTAAQGHYDVGVALIHEAQKAAEMGDGPGRDAKYRESLKELLDAEKLYADDAQLQWVIGQVYFLGFRRHDDAIAHLEKAIVLKAKTAPSDASPAEREYPEA